MTLQRKTLFGTVTAGVGLILALYIVAANTLRDGYLRLEETAIQKNAFRLSTALQDKLQSLESNCKDWSNWTATYDFVETRDPAYIQENLNLDSIVTIDLNFMIFVNTNREVVQALGVDLDENEFTQPPDSLLTLATQDHPFSENTEPDSSVTGIAALPEGVLLLTANPILKSDRSGPARGTLLFGRYLDSKEVDRLSTLTQLHVEFQTLNSNLLPASWKKDIPRTIESRSPIVRRIDEKTIAARFVVDDIFNNPTLMCSVESPRDIYAQGNLSLKQYIVGLTIVSVAIVVITLILLNHHVIRRVAQMQEDVSHITTKREFLSRLSAAGSDELAELGHDINHMLETINQVQDELHTARINAEAANESKSEFLANMSHEIRTPMTAILGLTETLLEPDIPNYERLDAILIIRRNGEHLLQIINDILDISKIEAGKVDIENIRCCPVQLVADVKSLMQMKAIAKDLAFTVEFVGSIPEFVHTDPTRLKQILVNLLGNAIKFTEHGGVRLLISFLQNDADSMLQCDVLDTGIGLTEKQINDLFKPFNQGDSTTTRRFGGTGLGLAISRRLAQLLGGDLTVRSTRGEGTAFRLRVKTGSLDDVTMLDLHAIASITDSQLPTKTHTALPQLAGRFLLVEDNETNRFIIQRLLEKAGASISSAANGKIAVDKALEAMEQGKPFDVILMDMQMPIMDGYEATRLLRRSNYTGPIIALTAHAMSGDRQKCLDAGCTDFATKPINRNLLLETIHTHLQPTSA